jgi:hypothetical protein
MRLTTVWTCSLNLTLRRNSNRVTFMDYLTISRLTIMISSWIPTPVITFRSPMKAYTIHIFITILIILIIITILILIITTTTTTIPIIITYPIIITTTTIIIIIIIMMKI